MVSDNNYEQKNRHQKQNSMQPTPINTALAVKTNGFTSLVDALDYAAKGDSGFNFYVGLDANEVTGLESSLKLTPCFIVSSLPASMQG
jgi:hypothetical protein